MDLTTAVKYCGSLICLSLLMAMPLAARTGLIYSANWLSGTIDVIDPVSNKVVQTIKVDLPHGVNFSPDGRRIYVTSEDDEVLHVLDRKTGELIKKVSLSGHPNNVTVTKDGGRILVCIRNNPGALDIVDANSLTLKKSIPVNGGLHNNALTPDGKYVVAGSIWGNVVNVIDLQSEELAWVVKFDRGVRPLTVEANPDGSSRRIFLQLTGFHGFVVVDFATHQEVARIKLPDEPKWYETGGQVGGASHGIGVAPNGKTLWVNSSITRSVFVYSLPDLQLIGRARAGRGVEWLTFSPDGETVYVTNSAENTVSAIDAKTMKEVARIPTHDDPKRISTLVLP
jgi:YVTN family beta-propeller protein